jgi:hypothetical protein
VHCNAAGSIEFQTGAGHVVDPDRLPGIREHFAGSYPMTSYYFESFCSLPQSDRWVRTTHPTQVPAVRDLHATVPPVHFQTLSVVPLLMSTARPADGCMLPSKCNRLSMACCCFTIEMLCSTIPVKGLCMQYTLKVCSASESPRLSYLFYRCRLCTI